MNETTPPHIAGHRHRLYMAWLVLRESVKSFGFNRGLERAAALSYYGFFAMIPLMLIVVVALGHVVASSDRALQQVAQTLSRFSPESGQLVLGEVGTLSRQRAWGVFSLLLLFWSATPLTGAIRSAFGVIFRTQPSGSFLSAKLRDAIAVVLLLGSLLLWVTGEALPPAVAREWIALPPAAVDLLLIALNGAVALLCMGLFYVALSPVRLSAGLLTAGTLLTVGLLGLIGPAFGLILRFNPNYGYAFGSLKAVFLLFLWVYYSFAAVLFAAEVMSNIRRRDALVLKTLFLPANAGRRSALVSRFSRAYAPGAIVVAEGDPGHEMFYVLEGTVQLTHRGQLLREMRPGDYFGEMSMLIKTPRTATVAAGAQGATLACVSEANFETVLRENPAIVHGILREMALRLKASNERQEAHPVPA